MNRYHLSNINNDDASSPSYFNELASFYRENGWRSSLRNNTFFRHKHTSLEKVFAAANRTIEKSTKFLDKIKTREIACVNRIKSIPENASIRKEYVKCGKEILPFYRTKKTFKA